MSKKKGRNTPALLLFLGRGAVLVNGDGEMMDDLRVSACAIQGQQILTGAPQLRWVYKLMIVKIFNGDLCKHRAWRFILTYCFVMNFSKEAFLSQTQIHAASSQKMLCLVSARLNPITLLKHIIPNPPKLTLGPNSEGLQYFHFLALKI